MSQALGVGPVANGDGAHENRSSFPFDEDVSKPSMVTANPFHVLVHIKNPGCSCCAQMLPYLESPVKMDPCARGDSSNGHTNSASAQRASLAQTLQVPKCGISVAGPLRTKLSTATEGEGSLDASLMPFSTKILSPQVEGSGSSTGTSVNRCLTKKNQADGVAEARVQDVPDRALNPKTVPSKWEVHYNMAIQALQSKRFPCAVTHFRDSLQIIDGTEINILRIADTHKGLGLAYASAGEDGKARVHLQECLDLETRELGNSDIRLVETTELLGEVCYRTGEYNVAKHNFERGLGISGAIWGSKHAKSIHILGSVGKTYYAAGFYRDALVTYRTVLRNTQELFGNEAVQTADAMNNIALVYRALSEYKRALTLLESAFNIYDSSLGPGQMKSADVANNIGVIYLDQNKLSEAKDYFKQAIGRYNRLLGKGHIKTSEALENLGITYQRLGNVRKALDCFARVLLITKKLPAGRTHNIHTANLYKNIGLLSQALGQRRLASRYFAKRGQILANRRKLCRVRTASSLERVRIRPNIRGREREAS